MFEPSATDSNSSSSSNDDSGSHSRVSLNAHAASTI